MNGSCRPEVPPVKERLDAAFWKMKKNAIVITTKVWRRTRSDIQPKGTAMAIATTPPRGTSQNIAAPGAM